jgi:hypothetical protein
MKKIILALSMLFSSTAFAQSETEAKTLIGSDGPESWGFMIGTGLQAAQVYGENTFFSQFKAGVVLNEAWTFGALAGFSLNEIRPTTLNLNNEELDFHIYGAFAEYRLKPNSLLHIAFPLNLGVFETDIDDFDYSENANDWDDYNAEEYQFFVEPGVNLELNLHKYVRIYTGASYRIQTGSIYNRGVTPAAENQLLWNIGLKVGIFSFK